MAIAVMLVPAATADDHALSAALATSDRRAPCRELAVSGLRAEGGCDLILRDGGMNFTVVNVLGDRRLADCGVAFRLLVGPDGSLAVKDFQTAPAYTAEGPCGDIVTCRRDLEGPSEHKLPWTGNLASREGRLYADIDICFDTCLGRFEGKTRMEFEPGPKGSWRLHARSAPVGTSGMELTGGWTLRSTFGGSLEVDAK
jgi:hypothetical protein